MVGIFKKNLLINSILLLPYLILVRIHTFIAPKAYTVLENDTYLTKVVFDFLDGPLMQSIIASVLVYFQAVYINRLVIRHKLALEMTLLPGLIYILFVSFPVYGILSPHLIANSFILIMMGQLFRIYKTPNVADNIFNVGLFIGWSALILPSHGILLLLGLIGVSILRSLKRNQFVQLISGFIVAWFVYGGVMYLNDHSIKDIFSPLLITPTFSIMQLFSGAKLIVFLTVLGLSIFYILNYRLYTLKKSMQAQKKVDILMFTLLFSLILLLFVDDITPYQILFWIIPACILTNMNFLKIKLPIVQELIHIALVALIVALSFGWL